MRSNTRSGKERWAITLLLGLFIVLFAMSTIDAKQFDNVKRSLSQTFNGAVLTESGGVLPGSTGAMDANTAAPTPSAVQIQEAVRTTAKTFDREAEQLRQLVKESGLGNDVQVVRNEQGILIKLRGDALFDPGSWAIRPSFQDKLERVEQELQQFGRPIKITGHTDGQPYGDGQWGNRGLSTNRANEVAKFFESLGYPGARIEVSGMGANKPAVDPPTPTASVPKNRRIEITVLAPAADAPLAGTRQFAAAAERAAERPDAPRDAQPTPSDVLNSAIVAELADTSKATS